MTKRLIALLSFVFLVLFVGNADAQSSTRGNSGFANTEMNRIRNQSIGRGFTSQDIINQNFRSSRGQPIRTGVGSIDNNLRRSSAVGVSPLAGSSAPSSRPFSNISRRPSVSPFLRLFDDDQSFSPNAGADTFQTVIRPAREQRQFNQQMQREAQQINARLQAISAQSAFSRTGNQNFAPTGMAPGVYRFYSHYYPGIR